MVLQVYSESKKLLENNPEVMNELARRIGVTKELSFYDV